MNSAQLIAPLVKTKCRTDIGASGGASISRDTLGFVHDRKHEGVSAHLWSESNSFARYWSSMSESGSPKSSAMSRS